MANELVQGKNTLYAPKFVDSWYENFLYPLADWINGMAFKDFNFSPKGKPVIKIVEIKNGITYQTKFTDGQYDEIYLLKKGDLLFCWSGQPETSIDVFWWNGPDGWLNQHTFKVVPKIKNKIFFFYLLKYIKPNFVQIAINKQTTGLGHVTKGDLERFIVKLPSPDEQRAIAAVLSSLDDKIELLREQNKTLEATAQTIFKEWFVKFNFPVEFKVNSEKLKVKSLGYSNAGGKMIDSELGKIPDGWRVGRLGNVTDIRGGTTPSTKNPDFWGGNIAWTSPKDLSNSKEIFLLQTEKKITEKGLKQISSGLLPKGTLLLSSRAPIGYLSISNLEIAINQGYIAFLPIQYFSNYFMFLWLKLNMQEVINAANGSTFLEISKSSFRNIYCVIPSESVLERFDGIIKPFFERILANLTQIQTLSALRDTLLPKLMKGEIRVKSEKLKVKNWK